MRSTEITLTAEDDKELDDASKLDWAYPYAFISRMQPW
jgi:hypothetical protein